MKKKELCRSSRRPTGETGTEQKRQRKGKRKAKLTWRAFRAGGLLFQTATLEVLRRTEMLLSYGLESARKGRGSKWKAGRVSLASCGGWQSRVRGCCHDLGTRRNSVSVAVDRLAIIPRRDRTFPLNKVRCGERRRPAHLDAASDGRGKRRTRCLDTCPINEGGFSNSEQRDT